MNVLDFMRSSGMQYLRWSDGIVVAPDDALYRAGVDGTRVIGRMYKVAVEGVGQTMDLRVLGGQLRVEVVVDDIDELVPAMEWLESRGLEFSGVYERQHGVLLEYVL